MRRQSGVTLIELLVGLTLLAVLLRIAVPSFTVMVQNASIRAVAESIQNGLNIARNEALERNRTVRFTMNGTGWQVCEMDDTATSCPTGNEIQSRAAAEAGGAGTVTPQERNASTNVAVGTPTFTGAISFNGLGRATTQFLPTGSLAVFQITHPVNTCVANSGPLRCLNVVVGNAGQVRMCDPNPGLPTDDPRRC